MKKTILSILIMMVTLAGYAQVEGERVINNVEPDTTITLTPTFELPARPWQYTMYMPTSPFNYGFGWDMHDGLNAQIGAGVMVGFGKHNPFKGASFFTDVSLAFVKPINKHWTLALGGTLSRYRIWNDYEWSTSIYAIANYKFNDHWSASVYGSYNHAPGGMGMYGIYSLHDMMNFNENFARFGGEVTYKFNNNFSLSLGVSTDIPVDNNPRPWKPQHQNQQKMQVPKVLNH